MTAERSWGANPWFDRMLNCGGFPLVEEPVQNLCQVQEFPLTFTDVVKRLAE